MKLFRRVLLWTVLGTTAALAVLSVAGAFLGAQRAAALFSSVPLIAFWILLAGGLAAGFFAFKRLIRSPGLLSMHVGALLILLGSMYGSAKSHDVASRLFGSRKVQSGYVVVREGMASNSIIDAEQNEIGRLPFSVHLKDFWLEHYEPEDGRWNLIVAAPDQYREDAPVAWNVGEEIELPYVGARLRVLDYIPSARPRFAEDAKPSLKITLPDGKWIIEDAQADREIFLEGPKLTLRIAHVFSNLRVVGSGEDREVFDFPRPRGNSALAVEIRHEYGAVGRRYVTARFPMHGQDEKGLKLMYSYPEVVGAEADPGTGLPAMHVVVTHGGKELEDWLIAAEGAGVVYLPLAPLLYAAGSESEALVQSMEGPKLYMAKPIMPISDFKSDVLVQEEGEAPVRKVIELNDPLHYGGYHLYQNSYNPEDHSYTILSVTSDSGLWVVYAGFFLLCAGVFWRLWLRPVAAYLTKGKRNGG